MVHDDDRDDGLDEVRAILGRLQRISRSHGDDLASPPLQPDPPEPFGDGAAPPPSRPRFVSAAVLLVPFAALVAGTALVVRTVDWGEPGVTAAGPGGAGPETPARVRRDDGQPGSVQPGAVRASEFEAGKSVVVAGTSLPPASPARYASELMASGRVQAARAALLGATPGDSPDIAFALARSYDPNYLATLPSADAAANVAEAKRWYRTWYDIAVRQGLVSNGVPLERLIRSLD